MAMHHPCIPTRCQEEALPLGMVTYFRGRGFMLRPRGDLTHIRGRRRIPALTSGAGRELGIASSTYHHSYSNSERSGAIPAYS